MGSTPDGELRKRIFWVNRLENVPSFSSLYPSHQFTHHLETLFFISGCGLQHPSKDTVRHREAGRSPRRRTRLQIYHLQECVSEHYIWCGVPQQRWRRNRPLHQAPLSIEPGPMTSWRSSSSLRTVKVIWISLSKVTNQAISEFNSLVPLFQNCTKTMYTMKLLM